MNNANLFLATNKPFGVRIEPKDRRFIVGARLEQKVYQTGWWLGDKIMIEKLAEEVEEFVFYLKQLKTKEDTLNRVVNNRAREELIGLSKTHTDLFFEAVRTGDFNWFKNNIQRRKVYKGEYEYEDAQEILSTIRRSVKVGRDDLILLYTNITGNEKSPAEFSRACTEHQVEVKSIRLGKDTPQGVEIYWPNEELRNFKKQSESNNGNREKIKELEDKDQLNMTI